MIKFANFKYTFIYNFSNIDILITLIYKTSLVVSFKVLTKSNNSVQVEKTIENSSKIKKLFKNLAKIKNLENLVF